MGAPSTAKDFVPQPVRVAPLDHQALLTLARKVYAAAGDCDCGHMGAAAKDFAGALGAHLRHETFTETEITAGQERNLRRGQVRLWSAANDLLTEADRGCPHSPSYCRSKAEELLALLTIQADDERRAFNHHPT